MKKPGIDAAWLYAQDLRFYNLFGQRFDVPGAARWSNPAAAEMRDGNHAAFAPGSTPIPEQFVRILDAQRSDGASPCVDVYGAPGVADELCLQYGLTKLEPPALDLWVVVRDHARCISIARAETAPPVVEIAPDDWVAATATLEGFLARSSRYEIAMAEAAARDVKFYGIAIGHRWVAAVARHDEGELSRITSLRVDRDFRRTGLARAVLVRAAGDAPHEAAFFEVAGGDESLRRLSLSIGADCAVRNAHRRHV